MIQKYRQYLASLRKIHIDHWVNPLFYLSLVIALIPVWVSKYFLTGDGPCHLYNSKVLLSFVTSEHLWFYENFYSLNTQTEPNWFGHVALASLLTFLPGFLAEKIFITAYVIGYAFSIRWLLLTIKPENAFLIFMGLPFMYVYTFQGGFYNYSWSFVFLFICLAYVLRSKIDLKWSQVGIFAMLSALLYFTHPVGWVLCVMAIGCMILIHFFVTPKAQPVESKNSYTSYFKIILGFLPALLLIIDYLLRKGISPIPNPVSIWKLIREFIELTALMTMTRQETAWALWVAILFGVVFGYALLIKVRKLQVQYTDAFFLMFLITLGLYLIQPDSIAGAGIIRLRLQFIPYLMLLLWLASLTFDRRAKGIVMFSALLLGTILIFLRLPIQIRAAHGVNELVTVADHIEDFSVVLPLSFSHNGKTPEGKLISNRIWLFIHAADYIGIDKNLILLGNYEANLGYFPLKWIPEKNPFQFLNTNEGMEHQPPSIDIAGYTEKTGVEIDYIITWCMDEEYRNHPYTINLLSELNSNYTLIFTSEHGRARVYKRKN